MGKGTTILITLEPEHSCLLGLLKTSLFDLPLVIPDGVNWNKLLEEAKCQCVVPLVSSNVPEEYRNEWLGISNQSKAHYMRMLYEQNSLVYLLKNSNIPFVILKGTAASIYYPSSSLRMFGDIDIYVSEDYFEFAKKLLEDNGYQLNHFNERHNGYLKNGILFELHRKYSSQYYKDIEQIVLKGLNSAVNYKVSNYSFPGLPTYENGLVLLGHIMQHLKESGIGLRQIIDWMMFVHKELDDYAWSEHFYPLAREAGLEKLAITVTFLCKKWLGLPNKISWCNTADEDVAEQLLIRVLDEGNLGKDRAPTESVNYSIRKEGVFKYLQRAGMYNWSLAQKYTFFRPFAWLYQLFRYVFMGIAGLFTGKKVFMKTKRNMSLEELWKRLE